MSHCREIGGQLFSIEHVRNQWQNEGAGGWVPSCCSKPYDLLSLLTKQEPLTFCCMLLISLLLSLPLQTTMFSLRIPHPLLLQLLSMLKVINSAPFSGPVPLKITASCLEWIIHQPNGLLPPRGLSQSFGTSARRSLTTQLVERGESSTPGARPAQAGVQCSSQRVHT